MMTADMQDVLMRWQTSGWSVHHTMAWLLHKAACYTHAVHTLLKWVADACSMPHYTWYAC
jgi:hypothetical protein